MHGLASPGQLRASRWRWIAVCVPLVVVLGFLSGAVAGNGGAWYAMLDKPAITPPGWVFPVAWTILYILQGVALALVLSASGARGRAVAAALFALQLALNVAWSPVFFGWHRPGPAFWVLVATLLTAVAATMAFGRVRTVAAWLMVPYLAWLGFAGVLNLTVDQMNPDAADLVPGRASTDIRR